MKALNIFLAAAMVLTSVSAMADSCYEDNRVNGKSRQYRDGGIICYVDIVIVNNRTVCPDEGYYYGEVIRTTEDSCQGTDVDRSEYSGSLEVKVRTDITGT